MATAIICGAILLLCIFGVRNYVKNIRHGCCGSGGDEVKKIRSQDTDRKNYPYTYQIRVEGMTCSNCTRRVENAFHEKGGFLAKANLTKKQLTLYAVEETDEAEIRNIIRRTGYEPGAVTRV